MRNMRTVRRLTLGAAALMMTAQFPSAYTLKTARWSSSPVPFYVNTQNLDVDPSAALSAVQFGAYAWTNQSNAVFSFYYAGSTAGTTVTSNGRNEVFFRNASNGNAIATTYTYSSGGRIIDTDIVFWDGAFKFFTGTSGCSGGLYIEDIATHEFGHAVGLGHSSVSGSTMYPSVSYCSTNARSLSEDDKQGVEALYPSAATNTSPQVRISSPSSGSSFADGSTLTFSGTASDPEDGSLGSAIVWTSSRDGEIGRGSSVQRVLSAGSHTITARVTDSNGAAANDQISVSIEAPPAPQTTPGIWVTVRGYKVKGLQKADLAWGGVSWVSVDIYRDGTKITTTARTDFTDAIDRRGAGNYTYVVCQAGTATCSQTASLRF